jgi:hypothetical protein
MELDQVAEEPAPRIDCNCPPFDAILCYLLLRIVDEILHSVRPTQLRLLTISKTQLFDKDTLDG